jgi:two-component system sensor histidine kinase BaeS
LSVKYKLFFTLLLATGLVVVGMYVFMQWSFERGFVRLVEARQQEAIDALASRLAESYAEDGGWGRLGADKRLWVRLLLEARGHRPGRRMPWLRGAFRDPSNTWPPPMPRRGPERPFKPLELRLMLLDADRTVIYGRPAQVERLSLNPIRHEGRVVGYLGVVPGPPIDQLWDIRFVEQQTESFVVIALAMVLFSALLALPIAHGLVRPLRAFTEASRSLAEGDFETRIPARSNDELGRLARDFNELARALERNEGLRRQWVADISHELRTPLSVLRGELEALQDGVRPVDGSAIDSLYADTLRLQRLVDDLYELSMSDLGALEYRKVPLDPVAILDADLQALAPELDARGIVLQRDSRLAGPVEIPGDPDRLSQLFRNLLQNTLRYTDPGGRLEVRVGREGHDLTLDLMDSAPGVAPEDLSRLFDRLYRAETSRSRAHGGAGLGLAICRTIVEAHGGRISAQASPLGGLWVRVTLPV